MKKQKPKKWGSRSQRDDYRWERSAYGLDKNMHTNKPVSEVFENKWPRAKSGFAKDMYKAGYFGAYLSSVEDWTYVHHWCKETFKQYSWNGNVFWFETKSEREAFMKQFESKEVT